MPNHGGLRMASWEDPPDRAPAGAWVWSGLAAQRGVNLWWWETGETEEASPKILPGSALNLRTGAPALALPRDLLRCPGFAFHPFAAMKVVVLVLAGSLGLNALLLAGFARRGGSEATIGVRQPAEW